MAPPATDTPATDTPAAHSPAAQIVALVHSLRATPARVIASPATQPRRASVAIVIRFRPPPASAIAADDCGHGYDLADFCRLPWVQHPATAPEILFIRRPAPARGHRTSHIAFPGGTHQPGDLSPQYTAIRETWDEAGIDLAEKEFLSVARLDDREVTTSLGKRLLMILSPFVYVQTSPFTPTPQPSRPSSLHWIPFSRLTPPFPPASWSHLSIDISTRLTPHNALVRWCLRNLIGKMTFACLLLPDEPASDPSEPTHARVLCLWGLTLGMTLDLVSHHPSTPSAPPPATHHTQRTPITVDSTFGDSYLPARPSTKRRTNRTRPRKTPGIGPSITAIFPAFTYPDINLYIYIFSRQYRRILDSWLRSPPLATTTTANRHKHVNWSGLALAAYYKAIRRALVLALLVRLTTGVGLLFGFATVLRKVLKRRF